MKTLKFNRDFDFRTSRQSVRAYKKGGVYHRQTEAAADAAVAAGAAEALPEQGDEQEARRRARK